MNTYLIHGEDNLRARNRFTHLSKDFQSRGYEIVGQEAANSLFSDKVLVVLENVKSLPQLNPNFDVLILYDGNATASLLKSLPDGTKIEKFDLPKKLFSFLNNISLNSFHEIIKTEPIELVFAMMGRLFRDMYWAAADPKSLEYPSWRVGKLAGQAKKYSLTKIISRLADIDSKSKTGEVDLLTSLDLFIASELE